VFVTASYNRLGKGSFWKAVFELRFKSRQLWVGKGKGRAFPLHAIKAYRGSRRLDKVS
jgi:hypothetical protein